MGEFRKITVTVDASLADELTQAVESGDYATEAEVLREALQGWHRRRQAREADLERLRAMIDEGFASGNPIEATDEFYESIKREGRERLARAGARGAE